MSTYLSVIWISLSQVFSLVSSGWEGKDREFDFTAPFSSARICLGRVVLPVFLNS